MVSCVDRASRMSIALPEKLFVLDVISDVVVYGVFCNFVGLEILDAEWLARLWDKGNFGCAPLLQH